MQSKRTGDLLLRKLNRCLNMRFSTMKFKLLMKDVNSRAMGDDEG